MSDDQDGCEWVSVPACPGSPGPKAVKSAVCVCVSACTDGPIHRHRLIGESG